MIRCHALQCIISAHFYEIPPDEFGIILNFEFKIKNKVVWVLTIYGCEGVKSAKDRDVFMPLHGDKYNHYLKIMSPELKSRYLGLCILFGIELSLINKVMMRTDSFQ